MLSQPFQNSDMFHRTETVSDLRAAQAQRDNAAQDYAHVLQQRKEEKRQSAVESTKGIDLDPDQLPERERQKRKRQKAKGQKDSNANPEVESKSVHINRGAGHIDLTA